MEELGRSDYTLRNYIRLLTNCYARKYLSKQNNKTKRKGSLRVSVDRVQAKEVSIIRYTIIITCKERKKLLFFLMSGSYLNKTKIGFWSLTRESQKWKKGNWTIDLLTLFWHRKLPRSTFFRILMLLFEGYHFQSLIHCYLKHVFRPFKPFLFFFRQYSVKNILCTNTSRIHFLKQQKVEITGA